MHTGNKRVIWAQENNYDFIESLLLCREQKDEIVTHTFLQIETIKINRDK